MSNQVQVADVPVLTVITATCEICSGEDELHHSQWGVICHECWVLFGFQEVSDD